MSFNKDGLTKFKDATRLNRDKKHLILLDANCTEHYPTMPDNALPIPAFEGDKDDTALIDVIPLLQGILNAKLDASKAIPNWNHLEDPGATYVKQLKSSAGGRGGAQQQAQSNVGGGEAPPAVGEALSSYSTPASGGVAAFAAPPAEVQHWELFGVRIW